MATYKFTEKEREQILRALAYRVEKLRGIRDEPGAEEQIDTSVSAMAKLREGFRP